MKAFYFVADVNKKVVRYNAQMLNYLLYVIAHKKVEYHIR
ncbi:conserved hypothetical protein [Alteromonas macleodii]